MLAAAIVAFVTAFAAVLVADRAAALGPCPGYLPHPRRFLALRVPYGNRKGLDKESSQDRRK